MMKKVITMILCFILLFPTLAGCSGGINGATELQYPDMWYLEREECRFDLSDKKRAETALGFDGIVNTGEPVKTPREGKLLAEALLRNMQSGSSDMYKDYYPAYVEYSTKDQIWIICFQLKKLVMGDYNLYIAIDGKDRTLITLW